MWHTLKSLTCNYDKTVAFWKLCMRASFHCDFIHGSSVLKDDFAEKQLSIAGIVSGPVV